MKKILLVVSILVIAVPVFPNTAEKITLDADRILEEVNQIIHPTDVENLIEIGRMQAKIGNQLAARALFEKAIRALEFSGRDDASVLSGVSYLIRERPLKNSQFIEIAFAQSEIGDQAAAAETLRRAFETIELIKKESNKMRGLQEIAAAQIRIRDLQGASITIQKAFQTADHLKNAAYYKIQTSTTVADMHTNLNNRESARQNLVEAISLLNVSMEESAEIEALVAISSSQARMDDQAAARKTFEKALSITDRLKDHNSRLTQRILALVKMVEVQVETGNKKEAPLLIQQALRAVESIKQEEKKSSALRNIAMAQARIGDVEGAYRSESLILDKKYSTQSFPYIAESQIKSGDLQNALKTVEMIGKTDPLRKESLLANIATALAKEGDLEKASQILNRIGHPFKLTVLRSLGRAKIKAGEGEGALVWANSFKSIERAYALLGVVDGILNT